MNQNLFIKKSSKDFQNFDQWPVLYCFFAISFLNLKTNHFFCFWLNINMWFSIIGSYASEKINHSNRIDCPKYLNKNQALLRHKSHVIAVLYLVYILGIQANWENWKKNTPNNLGYTENISKSPTPDSASNEVFRLIFIQPFCAINLIWWSIFQFGHAH